MISLSNDDLDTLVLDDVDAGLNVSTLDLGHPITRSVLTARSGTSGADDDTAYYGERVVSLDLQIFAGSERSRWQNLDLVKSYAQPGLRSTLTFEVPETGEQREAIVRFDSMSNPVDNGAMIEAQVIFVAPDGAHRGALPFTVNLEATAADSGRAYPLTYPRTYPAFATSPTEVVNLGNVAAPWVARIWGPCTGPTISNETTGEQIDLDGLTIDSGDYIEVDVAAKTILLNGDPDATRYSSFGFATSTWWTLPVGRSEVAFYADIVDDPAFAEFTWRDTYL